MLAFVACWAGPTEGGERALKPLRDAAPVVAEQVGAMPYPALNSAFDALYPPGGLQHYWKANFVQELTDEAIDAHLEHGPKVPVVNSTMHIYPINGACHRVAPDETAFAYRDATFATVILGMWPDAADNEANIAWVRDYYDAVAPLSEEGGYVNFMSGDDQDRIKANYKGNYDRLTRGQAEIRPRQPLPLEPEHPAVAAADRALKRRSPDRSRRRINCRRSRPRSGPSHEGDPLMSRLAAGIPRSR